MRHLPVLALMNDGTPLHWLSWEDSVVLKYKNLVAWSPTEDETSYFGGMSRMTGERSHIEVPSIIALKGNFKRKNSVPVLTNQNLAFRDRFICGYCSRLVRDQNITRDHIVPRSKGGKDTWTNVVLACKKCNNHKDNRTPEQAGMELIYVPYVPSRHEVLLTQNRNILFDQMDYLSKYVSPDSRILAHVRQRFQ